MSGGRQSRGAWIVGVLGVVGFSAVIAVLLTVVVAPALAVASATTQSAIGVFDSIPDYFSLDQQSQRNEIYATSKKGNVLIATVYDQNREEVGYDQISKYALEAAIDGEDKRFYDHGGIDLAGIIRAGVTNAAAGGTAQGASTITQQLVRQTFIQQCLQKPTYDEQVSCYKGAIAPSYSRKILEMKYAIALEKQYTKKEILTAYLNIVGFGGNTYGIEAASLQYFGIHASQLSIVQAASLIAIVQNPSSRNLGSPKDFAANQERRGYVLQSMLEAGDITQAEYTAANKIPVNKNFVKNGKTPQQGCRTANKYARWACDYVLKSVQDFDFLGATPEERQANWAKGGYQIYTSIDLDAQKVAQKLLWKWTPAKFAFPLGATASVIEPGTGRIRVMAQNKIFDDAKYPASKARDTAVNYNTNIDYGQSHGFQPGSTYKLFTLVDWLEHGHGIKEVLSADQTVIPNDEWTDSCTGGYNGAPYRVHNDAGESGPYTVERATWFSVNGVFLRMATKLDLCEIADVAKSMGAERADLTPLQTNPTSVIGTNEVAMQSMAEAYATIAAGGLHCDAIIVDSYAGPDGVKHKGQTPQCSQVVDPGIAATVEYTMAGTGIYGTGIAANPHDGTPNFMKTGTTDNNENRLVAGATSKNALIVWTGNIQGHTNLANYTVDGVNGMFLRDQIFRGTLAALDKKYGGKSFPKPPSKYLTGTKITIPSITGEKFTYSQAKAALTALGFSVRNGGGVNSDLPKGQVVKQSPSAGAKVVGGTTITLYTSKHNMTAIPDVTGLDLGDAKAALASAGWPGSKVTAKYVCAAGSSPAPGATPNGGELVTSQSPAGGAIAVIGHKVTLRLQFDDSNCVPTTTVPDLSGRSYGDAQTALGAAGLNMGGVTQTCETGSPRPGASNAGSTVTKQNPSAGTVVAEGSSVGVRVRLDPSQCT